MYLRLRVAKLHSQVIHKYSVPPSIYKLYTKEVNLLLRMPKLLRRDSIYQLKINTSFWLTNSNSEALFPLCSYYRKIHHFLRIIGV